MPKTHFTRSGGYAWVNSFYNELRTTGDVYYVCSVNGSNASGQGFSPESPFASIAYALTVCTPNNGDLIIVMPNHSETMIAAGTVNMNMVGVTVRGLGRGRQRPTINYGTNVAASFNITAAKCSVENLTFVGTGIDNVTAMINVSAADASILGCEFEHASAAGQAALCILTTAAADRLRVEGCDFHGSTDAGTSAAISLVGGDSIKILGNNFQGSYNQTGGVIKNATTDSTNLLVEGNKIVNRTAGSTKSIVLTASTTGVVCNNRLAILSGSAPITGALDHVGGNYYTAAAGVTAGTLL